MTAMTTRNPEAQTVQVINQILNSWRTQNKIVTAFFNKHDKGIYENEVAPGRNRAIYLLGHLIASNDNLLPLFGLGQRLFPDYEKLFSSNPDRTFGILPTIEKLKESWETLNEILESHFSKMSANDWLEKHTKVSEADFAIDPNRNKLNVLLGRTIHESYHVGQLAFLVPKI